MLMYQGCSKIKDDLVTPKITEPHGDGWLDPNSNNFHGDYVASTLNWDKTSCKTCHGNDYMGGSTGISCIKCHTLHKDGWMQTSSSNFHGRFIADTLKWNLNNCKTCHNSDYSGGNTGVSCLMCHTSSSGPEACNTCHGNSEHIYPPKALNGSTDPSYLGVGAHDAHLTTNMDERFSAPVACNECHLDISGFNDPNHIGTNPDGIAEINFGSLARTVLPGDPLTPNPQWDRTTGKCSNVYCHGYFKSGNRTNKPTFNNPGTVYCGTCHGDPNTGNPNPGFGSNFQSPHFNFWTINDCYLCHNTVINQSGQFINKNNHINGVINLNQ